MVLTVRCTPNLGVFPRKVEIWVDKVIVITPLYLCCELMFSCCTASDKECDICVGWVPNGDGREKDRRVQV